MAESLWKLGDLMDYQRKLESELPPLYDFEQVRPVHREIEAQILEYWELLHPVVNDFITSWFSIWFKSRKENQELQAKIERQSTLLIKYKEKSVERIQDIHHEIDTKKAEIHQANEKVQKIELGLQELEEMDKEKQLGIANLRTELEKELAELNLRISERQTRFEATQTQVFQSFQLKMLDFESEVASLKEQATIQQRKISIFESENETLRAQNIKLESLQEKIWEINEKLSGLSFTETKL